MESLRQLTTKDVTPTGADNRLQLAQGIENGESFGEVEYHRPDGSKRNALLSVVPISDNLIFGIALDITERKQMEAALEEERRRLQEALDDVRILRGILPICANCKKVRDDKGYWNQVEKYVSEHSEVKFSHGICPECLKILYPED